MMPTTTANRAGGLKMKPNQAASGFTLIEVLLLLVVVGFLLGVALPNSIRAQKEANAHHCRANLEDIQYAIQLWVSTGSVGPGEKVTFEKILEHLDRGRVNCPSGGDYNLSAVGEKPSCTIEGHSLMREEE